jgi:lipopolysaccharide/colanic/teichoic acid biosynthesis glycosyltransferase
MAKRAFDLIVSAIALTLLSPLLLLIALTVLITSGRPILHCSLRVGQYGKPFRMMKFRTMVPDAGQRGGTSTAENDPRITPIGKILRRYKLDELPQLFHVLTGQMSVVGPRPEFEEHTNLYSEEERAILGVKPGMTDLASVRFRHLNRILAHSDNPDEYFATHIRSEKNWLRLEYVRTRSFWLDLKIVVATLRAVLLPWGRENGLPETRDDRPGNQPRGNGGMGNRWTRVGKGR